MGQPQPHDPDETDDARADWLVGAEEGVDADRERTRSGELEALQRPKLVRPTAPEPSALPASGGFPRLHRGPALLPSRMPGLAETASTPTWDAGRNSVPLPHIERGEIPMRTSPVPELARDFPMDDAEERARVAAQVAEERAQAEAIAARPHEVVAPQEFEIPSVPAPWWARLPELLAIDRRLQIGLVIALLASGTYTFWPREEKTTSVGHLKQHPERYADVQVKVNGRVSEVFPVGGSWAYTLVQGRDTIVVFSRTRQPKLRDRLTVVGTLSSGFLDGKSRLAIFEATR